MTTVSQKVPVMDTSAWRAGLRVAAAEATMGAEPRPDSLENRPRAQPNCSASIRPLPTRAAEGRLGREGALEDKAEGRPHELASSCRG